MFESFAAFGEELLRELEQGPQPGFGGVLMVSGEDDVAPLWWLRDGVPTPQPDLPPELAREAWEHAAEWLQQDAEVDAEELFRVHDVARTTTLLTSYRTALTDAGIRFGAGQSHRGSQAAQLFFKGAALRHGMRPSEVSGRIDSADLAERRLPLVWAAYLQRRAPWTAVDLAARAAEGMRGEDAYAAFDAKAAEKVVSSPITTLKKKLRALREKVQARTADERARTTEQNRRTVVDQGDDGEGSWTLTGPIAVIAAINGSVSAAAVAAHGVPGETRTVAQLSFDIGRDLLIEGIKQAADPDRADLAVPHRKGVVPQVVVTVPVLTLLGRSTEHGRLEGCGPIAPETARRIAAEAPSFFRLLTHPVTGVVLDLDRTVYVPPADLRRWVRLRDETCRFPGCDRPASRCDLDHAAEWQRGGVTSAANLVSLCRPIHNAKSAGLADEVLRDDGVVDWEDAWGNRFSDPPPDAWDPAPFDLLDDPAA